MRVMMHDAKQQGRDRVYWTYAHDNARFAVKMPSTKNVAKSTDVEEVVEFGNNKIKIVAPKFSGEAKDWTSFKRALPEA